MYFLFCFFFFFFLAGSRGRENKKEPLNYKKGRIKELLEYFTSCVLASETTEITALQVARMSLQYECNIACEEVLSSLRR